MWETSPSIDHRADRVGRGQLGLGHRRQLNVVGIDHRAVARRLRTGQWRLRSPNVVDLGTHPATWEQAVVALTLAGGARAAASHATAGFLLGLVDVARPDRIDVVVPRDDHHRAAGVEFRSTRWLPDHDYLRMGPHRLTTPARTFYDLAGVLDLEQLELAVYDALRRRLTTLGGLFQAAAERQRAPGRKNLLRVLESVPPDLVRTESPLEVVAATLRDRWRLPAGVTQHAIFDPFGIFITRADVAWPDRRVAWFVDGASWHDTPTRRSRDRVQRDALEDNGWRVVVSRAADLRGPRRIATAATLREALTTTGVASA